MVMVKVNIQSFALGIHRVYEYVSCVRIAPHDPCRTLAETEVLLTANVLSEGPRKCVSQQHNQDLDSFSSSWVHSASGMRQEYVTRILLGDSTRNPNPLNTNPSRIPQPNRMSYEVQRL
jgi:hypothetical protein